MGLSTLRRASAAFTAAISLAASIAQAQVPPPPAFSPPPFVPPSQPANVFQPGAPADPSLGAGVPAAQPGMDFPPGFDPNNPTASSNTIPGSANGANTTFPPNGNTVPFQQNGQPPAGAFQPPGNFQQPGTFPAGNFNQQGFPSGQPLPPGALQQPREEKFVPSEVVAVLPNVRSHDLRAVIRTSMGDITIKLDRVKAPETVAHFVALARGEKEFVDVNTSKRVRRPFYNQLTFHRVVKNYLIQTGCPFGNGRGGPGDIATIKDEIKPPMKFDRAGLIAMAPVRNATGTDTVKDSIGSQFLITLRPMPEWDDKYTIFGEVEDGMDVVQKINSVKVGPTERPIKRVFLTEIDIIDPDQQAAPQPQPQPAQPPAPPADGAGQPDGSQQAPPPGDQLAPPPGDQLAPPPGQ